MNKIDKIIAAVCFLIVAAVSGISFLHAQSPNPNDAVLEKLDAQRMKAISDNDLGTVRALLADDYMHVNAVGQIMSLSDYFPHRLDSRRKSYRAPDAKVSIHYYGDIAIMVGHQFNDQVGKGMEEFAVTTIWHRVGDDSWKEVHETYAAVAKPCAAALPRQLCIK
jgi:hypothetical protein